MTIASMKAEDGRGLTSLVIGVICAAACSSSSNTFSAPHCTKDADCAAGQGCKTEPNDDGYCAPLCTSTSSCPTQQQCLKSTDSPKQECKEVGTHTGGNGVCDLYNGSFGPKNCNPGASSSSGTSGTSSGSSTSGTVSACTTPPAFACGTNATGTLPCGEGLVCCGFPGCETDESKKYSGNGATSKCMSPGAQVATFDHCPSPAVQLCAIDTDCGGGSFVCDKTLFYCRSGP